MTPSDERKACSLLKSWEKSALVVHGIVFFNVGGHRKFFGKVEGLTAESVLIVAGMAGVPINLKGAKVSEDPDGKALDITESSGDRYILYGSSAPEPVA